MMCEHRCLSGSLQIDEHMTHAALATFRHDQLWRSTYIMSILRRASWRAEKSLRLFAQIWVKKTFNGVIALTVYHLHCEAYPLAGGIACKSTMTKSMAKGD